MKLNTVGVIVARFQVPTLHAGHRYLIDVVRQQHEQTLIVLGDTEARQTERNPLDVATRRLMVQTAYPDVRIASIDDTSNDLHWSQALDEVIEREFPGNTAVLYGSRESCLSHYHGRYSTTEIPPKSCASGTEFRRRTDQPRSSADFRRGVIYAVQQHYPTSYQTVDVAVLSHDRTRVLVGKKNGDGDCWRFIGGFVDPNDASLEAAAKREVGEEASMIETDDYRYLGSWRVHDWRYPVGGRDAIMTAFFVAQYIFGAPRPADDIVALEWRKLDGLAESLVEEHRPLANALLSHLNHANS